MSARERQAVPDDVRWLLQPTVRALVETARAASA